MIEAWRPQLLGLAAVWCDARGKKPLPQRRDITPEALHAYRLLPVVWLVDRTPDRDFRYRLAGEDINAVFDRSLRGRLLDEIYRGDVAARIRARWNRLLDRREAGFSTGRIYAQVSSFSIGQRLILPLAGEDGAPAGLIGVTAYADTGGEDAPEPGQGDLDWAEEQFIPVGEIERIVRSGRP